MDDQDSSTSDIEQESDSTTPLPTGLSSDTAQTRPKIIKTRRRVVVEPVLFLYCLAVVGGQPVLEQYLYARFASEYPILNNATQDRNESQNPCQEAADVNVTDPVHIATQKVQAETSKLLMYLQMLSSLLSLFTTLIYGAYSDSAGRRIILILPCAAVTIKYIVNCFVIHFKLSVYILLLGQFLDGLSGGFPTIMLGTFAYIADTTAPEQRGMGIAIVEACLTLAMASSQLGLGYFIRAVGFFYPYLTVTGVLIIDMIYLLFFVPETVPRDPDSKFSVQNSFKRVFGAFTEKTDDRHIKLMLLVLGMLFYIIPWSPRISLQILFTMNIPLCWDSVKIGIYIAVSALVFQFGSLLSLKLFKICRIPEMWIAAIGCLSAIASWLTTAWANTTILMMIVCATGMLMMLPIAMYRTILSRLVRVDEQGATFAGVASVESVSALVGSALMNLIYQKTLYFMKGFVFIVGAISCLLSLVLILAIWTKFGNDLGEPARGRTVNSDTERPPLKKLVDLAPESPGLQ